ncbi:CLUMA_CG013328, isoform A [Clunio marinus]|uniref:CLUMA_CG013328, isoform A n=1 Tax=Clunio marinus TaxID=568069 RepID=A0A1J1IIH6_9DIPT|nr:CLUMA_CG013328, isoform A [Clunio marinus]
MKMMRRRLGFHLGTNNNTLLELFKFTSQSLAIMNLPESSGFLSLFFNCYKTWKISALHRQ